jgi:enoyl-CoA hydratase/carnithine racemase
LSRNVPRKKAAEMLFTGDPITAEEAERVGLVNKVVAPELLAEETLALARRVARFSSATLSTGKRNFYRQLQLNDAAASALATQVMATSSQSPDAKEGIDAFLSKRDPTWSDRQLVTP